MARKTKIIAEIGENHHGDWDIASAMLEKAAEAGADIVKFQSYTVDTFSPEDPEYNWFKKVAVPDEKHFEFKARAEQLGVEFISAPFSVERARFLIEKVKCSNIKIASASMMNFPMLDYINSQAMLVDQVYLSSGMATLDELREALGHLEKIKKVTVLHCVTAYPASPQQANLHCLATLRKIFPEYAIGYSDHVPGLNACLTSVALGAEVLEKHFTFSRHMPGSDHVGSMLPEELQELCDRVEEIEQLLGSGEKAPVKDECAIRDFVRNRCKAC
jgi:sialic acid synthase SpsE